MHAWYKTTNTCEVYHGSIELQIVVRLFMPQLVARFLWSLHTKAMPWLASYLTL